MHANLLSESGLIIVRAGGARRSRSAPDDVSPLFKRIAHARAKVTLNFDSAVDNRTARAAGAFQFLTQLPEELRVPGEPVHHRHRFAAAPFLLRSQFRDDACRDGLHCFARAALTVPLRPAAHRALAAGVGGVDQTRVVPVGHFSAAIPAIGTCCAEFCTCDTPSPPSSHDCTST
jgi:hypothetical protein